MPSNLISAAILAVVSTAASQAAEAGNPPAYEGCEWTETRLAAPGGAAISIAIQVCEDEDQQPAYEFNAEGELVERYGEFESVRAQLFRGSGMSHAELIAEIAAEAAGPEEAARCELSAYPDEGVWVYEPDVAYDEELRARNEPSEACGPYGVGNQVMFFMTVGTDAVAFVWAGQDVGMFDPWSIRLEE